MKAMILAAGLGTRLRPLSGPTPKCLMPLAGRPILDWTLRWLREHGVTECVINLHHMADRVRSFCGDGSPYDLRVHYSFEPELLGTAGAVKKAASHFDSPFFVIYADNFSCWDLGELERAFSKRRPAAAVAVHWRKDVTQSGMIELDPEDRILRFVEKPRPDEVTSRYVSAGFFHLDPGVLRYIPSGGFSDFGLHVFPKLLEAGEEMIAVRMEEPIIGIDTPASYRRACKLALKTGNGFRFSGTGK